MKQLSTVVFRKYYSNRSKKGIFFLFSAANECSIFGSRMVYVGSNQNKLQRPCSSNEGKCDVVQQCS